MIEIQRVGPERLADLEQLFSTRATLRGCRCMIFRRRPDGTVPEPDGKVRQQAMAELVRADVPVGLIGYAEGEPVAWCSVAPRETFRGLDVVGEPSDPCGRSPASGYIVPFFERHGFHEVAQLGSRRHVLRLDLNGA